MSLGEQVNVKWVAKLDDFLFFAESEGGIKSLIAGYKDQKTLENSSTFKQFSEETLSEKSSLLWIGNNFYLKKRQGDRAFWKDLDTSKYPFSAFQGVIENDYMHLHFRLHYNEKELPQATATNVGIISLEAPIATTPLWLKNHRTKEKDIAVQDEKMYFTFIPMREHSIEKQLSGRTRGQFNR